MAFTQGQKVALSDTAIYASSDAKNYFITKSGTYYVWSAVVVNQRIRVTSKSSYAGKAPADKYVTGWVNVSAITAGRNDTNTTIPQKTPTSTTSIATTTVVNSDVTPIGTVAGQVGYLGTVLFVVSQTMVKTLQDFTWSSTANYVEHARHLKRSKVEFTGANADTISFNMTLSAALGTNPIREYAKLLEYQRNGIAVPLKIGTKEFGFYRWVITALSFKGEYTDCEGDWIQATVTISLKAYEK